MLLSPFGLIHGFGFASVLRDLGLPQGALLTRSSVQSRRGGRPARDRERVPADRVRAARELVLRRLVFAGGSIAIAAIAGIWLVERAFNMKIIPLMNCLRNPISSRQPRPAS